VSEASRGLARLAVVGASGRMGRAVVRLAVESGLTIVCAVGASDLGRDVGELAGLGPIGRGVSDEVNDLAKANADCVIDFSAPDLLPRVAAAAALGGAALVCGTTGLGEKERAALDHAASKVPVLWEPNMSVGVFVLSRLLSQAVEMLGDTCDIEIVEAHHKAKVDAPSGTAMRLAEVAKRARDRSRGNADSAFVFGREGKPGARKPTEIGVLAVRGGDVIGDHHVHLLAEGERLELTHRAQGRELFASGALRAARFISGKKAGRYGLADVLGVA
jgi:4-hydroxy-tetrahydrodipicolinate reductase